MRSMATLAVAFCTALSLGCSTEGEFDGGDVDILAGAPCPCQDPVTLWVHMEAAAEAVVTCEPTLEQNRSDGTSEAKAEEVGRFNGFGGIHKICPGTGLRFSVHLGGNAEMWTESLEGKRVPLVFVLPSGAVRKAWGVSSPQGTITVVVP